MARPLFKYMEERFAHDFVDRGVLLVGTLHDFRDKERHTADVLDEEEGVVRTYSFQESLTLSGGDRINPIVDRCVRVAPGVSAHFRNMLFSVTDRSPDMFLFCTSGIADYAVMKRCDPKYDTCVEIRDPDLLMQLITDALHQWGWGVHVGARADCKYEPRWRSQEHTSTTPAALVKDPKFDYQLEHRMMWPSTSGSLRPVLIQVPNTQDVCTIRPLARAGGG
jgi:hypothetical protein